MRAVWRQLREAWMAALAEAALTVGTITLVSYLRLGNGLAHQAGAPYASRIALIAAVWTAALYYADLFQGRTLLDRQLTLVRLWQAAFVASIALVAVYFWLPSLAVGRVVLGLTMAALTVLAFGWRLLLDWHHGRVRRPERLLVVGTSPESVRVTRELYRHRQQIGIEVVGFVDRDPTRVGAPLFNPAIVGTIDRLGDTIVRCNADRVVISALSPLDEVPVDELMRLRVSGVPFDHLGGVYEEYTGRLAPGVLTPMSLLASTGFRHHSAMQASKRLLDITIASAGLLLAAPLALLAAVAIKLTSPGPILYRQQRVGQGGAPFTMLKFRSMQADAEHATGAVWASANDSRVTPVGRLLRTTRFDELPQLWNVLRGEMSVVGPRPERPEIDKRLLTEIPLYAQRRLVKPGLTGWAQVRHRYAATVDDVHVKLEYDLFYIKHLSIALDLLILLMTTKTVLRGSGAR